MSNDPGEKFYLDDWGFGEGLGQWRGDSGGTEGLLQDERYSNTSVDSDLFSVIARHSNHDATDSWLSRRNIFRRDFQCPSGTHSCSSIGQEDLCCEVGETCVLTSDGPGCCPAGSICGDDVSNCDLSDGYTSCPNSPNGGCCIPGADCEGVGCVFRGTRTVTLTLGTTETTRASFTTQTSSGRTVTIAYPTTQTLVTTTTVTIRASESSTTQSSTSLTCSTGFFSCPGGGCCPNGQACGPGDSCPDLSKSATAGPPVLKTSASFSPETASTTTVVGCPTGFYQCSARYLGGCCRVGRDCHTTSCPTQDTQTLVSSRITVAVTGGGAEVTQGSCANGWALCGRGGGGGCCPSGYVCGSISCKATNPGQDDTLKKAPSSANVLRWVWSFLALGLVTGIGMIVV